MKSLLWILAALSFLACSIGGAPVRVVNGKQFPAKDVVLIDKGMTPAEVESILGPPLTRSEGDDISKWHYFYRMSKDDVIRILGFIPIRRGLATWETEAVIEFANERVESIFVSENRVK